MAITWWQALGLRLRRTPVATMRRAMRVVEEHGLPVELAELEAHHLAGGDVEKLLSAAVKHLDRVFPDNFKRLCAADLAGEDLDAFIERGFLLPREARRLELRALAESDERAAAELHDLLSEDLAQLREMIERVLTDRRVPKSVRAKAEAAAGEAGGKLRAELADLEARWPALQRSSRPGPAD